MNYKRCIFLVLNQILSLSSFWSLNKVYTQQLLVLNGEKLLQFTAAIITLLFMECCSAAVTEGECIYHVILVDQFDTLHTLYV